MAEYEPNRDGRIVEARKPASNVWLLALLVIAALVVAAFAFGLVNVDKVADGKAPTVKLETTAGEAPKFDVNTGKIEIGKKEETVTVPTVNVERANDNN